MKLGSDSQEPEKKIDYEKLENAPSNQLQIDEAAPWLMSFADMVTLLMCFFILFFQTDMGNIKIQNPEELIEKLKKLQQILGVEKKEEQETIVSFNERTTSGASGSVEKLREELVKISKQLDMLFSIGVTRPGEIELTFLNQRFFKSGSTDLTVKAEKLLKDVSRRLMVHNMDSSIEVEGHTDGDPIKSWRFPSNWELSGARAATVVRLLEGHGLEPSKMSAVGLAHTRPIAEEVSSDPYKLRQIKALNRRIVIKIKEDVVRKKKPKRIDPTPSAPENKKKMKMKDVNNALDKMTE